MMAPFSGRMLPLVSYNYCVAALKAQHIASRALGYALGYLAEWVNKSRFGHLTIILCW